MMKGFGCCGPDIPDDRGQGFDQKITGSLFCINQGRAVICFQDSPGYLGADFHEVDGEGLAVSDYQNSGIQFKQEPMNRM